MGRIMRVAVMENGIKINTILVDEDALDRYWPGYGDAMLVEGPEAPEPENERIDSSVRPKGFKVFTNLKLDAIPQIGDTVNLKSGKVTPAEPEAVDVEAAAEEVVK